MTLTLPNMLIRKILILLVSGFFLSFFASSVFAQDATESAENVRKFKIVFPIEELGSCASVKECKEFCNEEANRQVCLDYARKKGFAKERKALNAITASLVQKARLELGCASASECRSFCKLDENVEKCADFAWVNGLKGGLKIATPSGKLRGPREATGSGGKFTPNSERAFERANANARFCREYPEKCKNASGSAQLERKKLESNRGEDKKKEMELRKAAKADKLLEESEVQGASSTPSLYEKIFRFFMR